MDKNKIYAIEKDDKAITLITLVVTIIVLLILAGVATFSGIEAINNTKYTKFKSELKIMQTHVNKWYEQLQPRGEETFEQNIASKFNGVNAINANGNTQDATKAQNTLSIVGVSNYSDYYLLKDTQKQQLGIEGVEQDIIVSVKDRKVVSYEGFRYKNNTYYTLDDLNEVYNVDYTAQEGNPLFTVSYTYNKNSDLYNININNINYEGPIAKWNVKYKLIGEDSWTVSKELNFTIKKCGKYEFKLFNGDVETEELGKQEVMIIPVENIQNNYYLIMMNDTKTNFTGCTNVGTIEEFRDLLNAGNFNYDIAYVIQDINIGGNEDNQWTPIGTSSKVFDKVFDGQNYTIDGVYIKGDKEYQGLFKRNYGTIKNINANNFYIDTSVGTGMRNAGIVAYNEGTVENCVLNNSRLITDGTYTGGITGVNNGGIIRNCKNYAEISGADYVAGIAGYSKVSSTIEDSCNFGNITSESTQVSGTSGIQRISRVAGIAGSCASSNIKNCYNKGKILGNGIQIGGIVGNNNTSSVIENCYNDGDVATTSLDSAGVSGQIGGIVGANLSSATIKKCYNKKSVTGGINTNVGGIAGLCGYTSQRGYIENCYNTGNISANRVVAGIAGGFANGSITNCYNIGQIISNDTVKGAITSYTGTTQGSRDISNCYYLTGTCTGGINSADETGKAESRSASQMKADAFVTLLNGDGDVWQKDSKSLNDGYPVFK